MTKTRGVTEQAVEFIERFGYDDLPKEALAIGRRCILDSLGLFIAGTTESSIAILVEEALAVGGREEAMLLGAPGRQVPAASAARVIGAAGHAHDWDDTQVSDDPDHVYGLLTHPSVPSITASLTVAQKLGGVDGKTLMLAFQTGFEVECKISEWMTPDHYLRGHHTSATVGTFGACVAAAKLLGLSGEKLRHAIGIAASFAAGIRCNFGTMSKPLHVGRASENGVTAANLAARGFTADPDALDGRWGFLQVLGGGFDEDKAARGFANPLTIISPGVSIKPYPSGILTHQAMDAMLKLVTDNDVGPDDIERIDFFAGSNILDPIRYPIARNHLQAKFSMAALLSMIALYRKAGRQEFTDDCVGSDAMQAMQARISVENDPDIEARGFDKIRSRIELVKKDGGRIVQWADERYRGGPALPMTDGDLEGKFHACADGLLDEARQRAVIAAVWALETLERGDSLLDLVQLPINRADESRLRAV
jgi:2-methylcitrate dehydratase PrpD